MDLSLTDAQQSNTTQLQELLAKRCTPARVREIEASESGFCPELWEALRSGGWLARAPLFDLVLRFEVFGRTAMAGPSLAHFESLLLAEEEGVELPRDTLLTPLALLEASGAQGLDSLRVQCPKAGDGFELSGVKFFVPWADASDVLFVVACSEACGGLALFVVGAGTAGVARTPLVSLGAERLFEVAFDEVRLPASACLASGIDDSLARSLSLTTVLVCAELAGLARSSLELAVAHAQTREQFGQPIGAFQAVAHHCANMAMDVDAARLAVYDAAARIDAGEEASGHASRAKIVCTEAARRVTATAHQVMGGAGFLEDCDLQLFTRRAKALESRLGTPDEHRERLADAMGVS